MSIVVKIAKTHPDATIPAPASDGAAALDLYAFCVQSKIREERQQVIHHLKDGAKKILPGESVLFGTGIQLAIPTGFVAQVCPRSGLALYHEIEIPNSPGLVDSDFRGTIGIQLRNDGTEAFTVKYGDRIAQLLVQSHEEINLVEVSADKLGSTVRGSGGWSSTETTGQGLWTGSRTEQTRRLDLFFMRLALRAAELSDCVRGCPRIAGEVIRDADGRFQGQARRYGCVVARELSVISIGFNHQTLGSDPCAKVGCLRDALEIKTGTQIEVCRAQHAEQAAIGAAEGSFDRATIYITAAPCLFCARQIAGLKRRGLNAVVVLAGEYPNNGLNIVRDADIAVRTVEVPEILILRQLEELMANGVGVEQVLQALSVLATG